MFIQIPAIVLPIAMVSVPILIVIIAGIRSDPKFTLGFLAVTLGILSVFSGACLLLYDLSMR